DYLPVLLLYMTTASFCGYHYSKPIHISEKAYINKQQKKDDENPTQRAVRQVTNNEKTTAKDSIFYGRQFVKKRREKNRLKKEKSRIQLETRDIGEIKTRFLLKEKRQKEFVNKNKSQMFSRTRFVGDRIKIKSSQSQNIHFRFINKQDYQKNMKRLMLRKHIQKIKEVKTTAQTSKQTGNVVVRGFKGALHVTKKVVTSVNNLVAAGSFLILLVVLVLFMSVFSVLSSDSGINSATEPLSTEVIAYRSTIEKYAKDYDMEEYVYLIQAVMMQESGGQGKDPMQSSECPHNKKYPQKPNGITDPDYSIQVGIHYLSDCFKEAKVESPYDMERISLGLQGYNFGNGYISWAVRNFSGYTKANARVFSDQKKAELGWSTYGDPDYVPHVIRYYHFGNSDIVIVAKTQVGNIGGKPYWKWYGFNTRVEWCACFVSWCANESGILDITIPKFARVEDGIQWYKNKGQWKNKNYIPSSGDLIFFDWQKDGNPNHVGIVERVENNTVYTIEGNSSDECRERSYSFGSNVIFGYGIIKQ
ncbi:lysozyme family protein, partial [Thomasclavelia cocleata]|uniref:lysozyme family protein n=1 Tax=Thomasclavelia cocleata TaxID=69824 RepID=UPI00242B2C98